MIRPCRLWTLLVSISVVRSHAMFGGSRTTCSSPRFSCPGSGQVSLPTRRVGFPYATCQLVEISQSWKSVRDQCHNDVTCEPSLSLSKIPGCTGFGVNHAGFDVACNVHRVCYNWAVKSRHRCDSDFYNNMLEACGIPGQANRCKSDCADIYAALQHWAEADQVYGKFVKNRCDWY